MGGYVSDEFMKRLLHFGGYRGKLGDGKYKLIPNSGFIIKPEAHVTIGADIVTNKEVYIPHRVRDQHVVLIGKTRSGKTSLLEHFIFEDLRKEQAAFVLDPHGELTDRVLALALPAYTDRIINLDVDPSSPESIFGLNLFACPDPEDDAQVISAADSVVAAVKKAYGQGGEFLPRLERYLHLSVRTLIPTQLTLPDVPRLLIDPDFRKRCIHNVGNSDVQAQLRQSWLHYDQLRPLDQENHIEAVVNRLETLLAPAFMQRMLGSSETTIPFDRIFTGKAVLIITLRPRKNVLTTERADVIGALLLIELKRQLFAREISLTEKPERLHVYVDEYQRFATGTTAELLTQGAKFGAGLTLAYQNLSQITDETIRGSARGTGTLIALRVSRPDADEIAGEFPVKRRPARTETIEVLDGKEPVKVPTLKPGAHLATNGHNDPQVSAAAERLFTQGDKKLHERKPADPVPIPYEHPGVNKLFVDIMYGRVPDLHERLVDMLYGFSRQILDPEYYYYPMLLEHNWLFLDWQKMGYDKMRATLSTWLKVYIEHDQEFRSGVSPCALPDSSLQAKESRVRWLLSYRTSPDASDAFRLADNNVLAVAIEPGGWNDMQRGSDKWFQEMTNPKHSLRNSINILRDRMRCLYIICTALREEPILVESGQERDRYRQVVINHPEQTEQDAITGFAGKLVNPDGNEEWIAHVKLPVGYHKVKLLPPVNGEPNEQQLSDIRTRSRQQYQAAPRILPDNAFPEDQLPKPSPSQDPGQPNTKRPSIRRRPPEENA